jgi:hypothetical protein
MLLYWIHSPDTNVHKGEFARKIKTTAMQLAFAFARSLAEFCILPGVDASAGH